MEKDDKTNKNIETAREYFRRKGAGSPDLLDLFTDDVQIYFPKYGIARGREGIIEIGSKLAAQVVSCEYDVSDYLFIGSGDIIAVEGTTRGRLADGEEWAVGDTPAGRFCDVFEFRDGLISRVHIYQDPDFGSQDEARFYWGREQRTW